MPPQTSEYKPVPEISKETLEKYEKTHEKEEFVSEKGLRESIKAIRNTIRNEETRLRNKYTWLNYQDTIGLLCFTLSTGSIFLVSYLYLVGVLHWSLTIPLLALSGSIIHELEHDLIHNLYFKGKKWVQDLMFVAIWITKMSIPPWYRKVLHLRHHVVSGTKDDVEERLIGNGLPLHSIRWMLTLNPLSATFTFDDIKKDNDDFNPIGIFLCSAPTIIPVAIVWQLFNEYVRLSLGLTFTQYDYALFLPAWGWPIVRDFAVLMIFPNVLRQTCLNLIASYSHYYGDIPKNNVFYQNQIIDHWMCYPLQLFSFNFGATHIFHHFVPNQPFYMRQMLAPKATETCIKHGIRRNDFEIVKRANRFYDLNLEKEQKMVKAQ